MRVLVFGKPTYVKKERRSVAGCKTTAYRFFRRRRSFVRVGNVEKEEEVGPTTGRKILSSSLSLSLSLSRVGVAECLCTALLRLSSARSMLHLFYPRSLFLPRIFFLISSAAASSPSSES